MIHHGMRAGNKMKTSSIVSAILLLLGVLVMAFGFHTNNSHVIYVGIFITGAMAWSTLMITFTGKARHTRSPQVPGHFISTRLTK
jgi:hypothetical protein